MSGTASEPGLTVWLEFLNTFETLLNCFKTDIKETHPLARITGVFEFIAVAGISFGILWKVFEGKNSTVLNSGESSGKGDVWRYFLISLRKSTQRIKH